MARGRTIEIATSSIRITSYTDIGENDDQHSVKRLDVGRSIDHSWDHGVDFVHRDDNTDINCRREVQKRFVGNTKINKSYLPAIERICVTVVRRDPIKQFHRYKVNICFWKIGLKLIFVLVPFRKYSQFRIISTGPL